MRLNISQADVLALAILEIRHLLAGELGVSVNRACADFCVNRVRTARGFAHVCARTWRNAGSKACR